MRVAPILAVLLAVAALAPRAQADAARDHVLRLLKIQRQMLLGEVDRPAQESDTWIEPKIIRFPPGGRPLPDPHALDASPGASAGASSPANRRPSDPRNDRSPGSTQSEASVAIWHGLMLAAWNDGELLGDHTGSIGWGVSIDGGRSWVDGGGPPVGGDVVSWSSDPVVIVDEQTGWFYLGGLAIGSGPRNAIAIVRGRFLGGTFVWDTPRLVRAVRDTVVDKPWFAVDSATGVLHATYTSFFRDLDDEPSDRIDHQRSLDQGASWSPPGELSLESERGLVQGSRVTTLHEDQVVTLYRALDRDPDAGGIDHIRVRISSDGGATFAPPVDAATAFTNYGAGAPGFDRGFAPNFASLAVDRSKGPHRGRIYVAWNESIGFSDDPLGTAGALGEVEPNTSLEDATPFAIGASVHGTIGDVSDSDRYRFTGASGQTVIVLIDTTEAGPLALRLEQGGTGAPLALSQPIPVRARLIVFTLPETGEYFLSLSSSARTGAYELQTGWGRRGSERARDHRDVFVTWSDNGFDWFPPVRVNDDAPRFENWMPEVAVDAEGRVFAAWLDWRDSEPGAVPSSHVYLARSDDGGAHWTALGPVSTAPTAWTNVSTNLVPNQGDYLAMVADSAFAYPVWGDGRSGTPDVFLGMWPVDYVTNRFVTGETVADTSSVTVEWRAQAEGLLARIERSVERGPWSLFEMRRSDRARRIVTVDPDVPPGSYVQYRLQIETENGFRTVTGAEALLPGGAPPRLALARASGPAGALVVNFHLGAGTTGDIELLDLGGRRLLQRTVQGGIDSGGTVELAGSGALRAGVYFVRLSQAGEARTLKAVVLN